jgi:hypothetical protein
VNEAQTRQCPSCGAALATGALKCAYCGVDAPAAAVRRELASSPPGSPDQNPNPQPPSQSQSPKARLAGIWDRVVDIIVLWLLVFPFLLVFTVITAMWLGYWVLPIGAVGLAGCIAALRKWLPIQPRFHQWCQVGAVLSGFWILFSLIGGSIKADEAAREAERRRSDLAALPEKLAKWSADLAQVQKLAEAPEFVGGGLATVDAVTAAATTMASNLPGYRPEIVASEPSSVPWLAQIKTEAATVRAKYAVRANFEQAVREAGEQFQAAKDQTATHDYVAADRACTTALARLDTIGKADAWLVGLLPAGFDRAAKQKEIGAFRVQVAALAKAEEKKRLAARQFTWLQPEALAQQVVARNDPDELWGTQYQGKFVRWQAKYERSGIIVKFVASTGDFTSLSCKDFDPAHDPAKFDDVQQWGRISVEGKLDSFQKQMGKDKVEFILTECIARKM